MTKPAKKQDAAPPKWRVTGFEWIHRKQLSPHPEAEVPMGDEDEEALQKSVSESGQIQPLIVMKQKPRAREFWIVDGIHRFQVGVAAGIQQFPCVVVELAEGATVRDLALECASVGRSRSAGQRILVRLERDKAQILAAAEMGREANLKQSEVSRETSEKIRDFRADAIAREIGVSKQDTLLAIELLRSHEERRAIPSVIGGIRRKGDKLEEGDPELAAIDDAWGRVLAGTLPIRRWKAAAMGAARTKNVGKSETNWRLVARDAVVKLRTSLAEHWHKLSFDDRLKTLEELREVAPNLPREVREIFAGN